MKSYAGQANAIGCDSSANPGRFSLNSEAIYYLLFRSGGASYGSSGIVLDNVSIKAVN